MRTLATIILILLSTSGYADMAYSDTPLDTSQRDSLLFELAEVNSNVEKHAIYISLADVYLNVNDSLVLDYCDKVIQSDPKASNLHLGKAYYYTAMVDVYNNELANSIATLETAIHYFESEKEVPNEDLAHA